MADTVFDQLIFSGGGTRCMWQGGFMEVLRHEIPINPARVTGVSGGACSACGFITHRGTFVRDVFIEKFEKYDRNVPLHEPFDDGDGYSPHQRIYREVITACFGDPEAIEAIAKGPQFEVLIARPPDRTWPKLSGATMTLLYEADSTVRSNPHLTWPQAAGLKGEMVDARAAARDGHVLDLICAAATIPPAFEPPLWDGKPAVDAGMVDQAPLPSGNSGRSLVLLTKAFNHIPEEDGVIFVQPSEEVPADKIDFTDPQKLRDTWALGEEDARNFLRNIGDIFEV